MIYKEDNTGVKYIEYFMFLKNIEKKPKIFRNQLEGTFLK